MALFQKSVLNKYLKTLSEDKVNKAYQRFKASFQTEERIKVIRSMKEEEYQAGFLDDLFVKVLGYTLKPNDGFNLELEKKNTSNAKKADGAILINDQVVGVIELKSTSTTDIRKIEYQAFGYKSTHPNCKYVITSNFAILRFYVNDTTSFEDFHLFDLTEERFKVLYLLLSWVNMANGLPSTIKNESVLQEEEITKKLYKDYSHFKIQLFNSIKSRNTQYDELLLFKKTQKLLDRLLFIFFAEDKGLLPPNSISRIIDRFKLLEEEDAYKPLYEIFQQYFGYINKGREAKGKRPAIFAFNGGLFAPDEVLDNLKMSDNVLVTNCRLLSGYDFETEVDVNILGHIFEHSLNEIEEISAKIEGKALDKNKTKRKKDGVFYTPKYITKYIVENTIGKLCEEKKTDLGIDVEEYLKDRKGRTKKKLKALEQQLQDYQDFLFSLRICDPAVGSGAFLNQAFNFLIEEHEYIAFLRKSLLGESIQFDVTNDILEKNLYGVDINEESVDIAKLSLWLRTAKKGRTLASLNNNLKCGNSLIDAPNVAGEKAFDWKKEFPEVFKKGGFDVVIGNPPYVRQELIGDFKDFFEQRYSSFAGTADLFTYFYEQGLNITNQKGLLSYITNDFNKTTSSLKLRKFLQEKSNFISYDDFSAVKVFEGTTTYPIILTLSIQGDDDFLYCKYDEESIFNIPVSKNQNAVTVKQTLLNPANWTFKSDTEITLLNKIKQHHTIRDKLGKCYYGVKTGYNDGFITHEEIEESENIKFYLEGKDLAKWNIPQSSKKLILFPSKSTKQLFGDLDEEMALEKMKEKYPRIINLLLPHTEKAKKRYDKGDYWWELRNCAYYHLFENPKIVFPNLQNSNKFSFDDTGRYVNAPAVILPTIDKSILCILNSKVVWYFLSQICVVRSGGYIEVKPQYFEQIPFPDHSEIKKDLTVFANNQISLTEKLQSLLHKFQRTIKRKFDLKSFSKKLQNWNTLTYPDFVKELKKKKIKLGLAEEVEWEDYFEAEKAKAQEIQTVIDKTDKKIDQMVYGLYGLTEEEIGIVENS